MIKNDRIFIQNFDESVEIFELLTQPVYLKLIFEFLRECQKRKYIWAHDIDYLLIKEFSKLKAHEEGFNDKLNELSNELNNLYEIIPPFIKKVVHQQMLNDIKKLSSSIKKTNLIRTINNINKSKYQTVRVYTNDFPVTYYENVRKRDKADRIPNVYIKSPIFDEYISKLGAFLNAITFACFKSDDLKLIQNKIDGKVAIIDNKQTELSYSNNSFYGVPELELIISDYNEFIKICNDYSEEVEFKANNKSFKFKFITHDVSNNEYHWNRYKRGAITTPLRYFLKMLFDLELFNFNTYSKKDVTNSFLEFFHIGNLIKDHKHLFKDFEETNDPLYKDLFKYPTE